MSHQKWKKTFGSSWFHVYTDSNEESAGPGSTNHEGDSYHAHHDRTTSSKTTGITVEGVRNGKYSDETRPKNMKVTFIMKVC